MAGEGRWGARARPNHTAAEAVATVKQLRRSSTAKPAQQRQLKSSTKTAAKERQKRLYNKISKAKVIQKINKGIAGKQEHPFPCSLDQLTEMPSTPTGEHRQDPEIRTIKVEGPFSTAYGATSGTVSSLPLAAPCTGSPGTTGDGGTVGDGGMLSAQQSPRGPLTNSEKLRMMRLRKKKQRETMTDKLLDNSNHNTAAIVRTIREMYEKHREAMVKARERDAENRAILVRMMIGNQEKNAKELIELHKESISTIQNLIQDSRNDFKEVLEKQTAILESLVRVMQPMAQQVPSPAVYSQTAYQAPFQAAFPGPSQGFGQGVCTFPPHMQSPLQAAVQPSNRSQEETPACPLTVSSPVRGGGG